MKVEWFSISLNLKPESRVRVRLWYQLEKCLNGKFWRVKLLELKKVKGLHCDSEFRTGEEERPTTRLRLHALVPHD